MASLTTMGYICEDLGPDDIPDEVKNQIMTALVTNITDNETGDYLKVTQLSIKALSSSIP